MLHRATIKSGLSEVVLLLSVLLRTGRLVTHLHVHTHTISVSALLNTCFMHFKNLKLEINQRSYVTLYRDGHTCKKHSEDSGWQCVEKDLNPFCCFHWIDLASLGCNIFKPLLTPILIWGTGWVGSGCDRATGDSSRPDSHNRTVTPTPWCHTCCLPFCHVSDWPFVTHNLYLLLFSNFKVNIVDNQC